jgi:hypothetical protein
MTVVDQIDTQRSFQGLPIAIEDRQVFDSVRKNHGPNNVPARDFHSGKRSLIVVDLGIFAN